MLLSIQEVGKQVLTGNPKCFYIFIGAEYGIKEKYLNNLKNHYHESVEFDKVSDLFDLMSKKHIIPIQPKLYIVRYDEEFIKSLDKNSSSKIQKIESKIIGTLVCIYELPKHTAKCAKYLPDYTVSFDMVNIDFIKKYLIADFPELDNRLIDFSVKLHQDYKSAYNTCLSLNTANIDVVDQYNYDDLSKALGICFSTSDNQFRYGVASRNFSYCLSVIDNYNGQLDSLFYVFLATLIDLEKQICNARNKYDLSKYIKCWNINDIYHMFMNVYKELEKSRTLSSYNVYAGLVYLVGVLQFSPVPKDGELL